jgi:hypothetical protein
MKPDELEKLIKKRGLELILVYGSIAFLKKERRYQWLDFRQDLEGVEEDLEQMEEAHLDTGDKCYSWVNGTGPFIVLVEKYLADGGDGNSELRVALDAFRKEMT